MYQTEHRPTFWRCQIVGWLLYTLYTYFAYGVSTELGSAKVFTYYFIEMALGVVLTLLLRKLFQRIWSAPVWTIWLTVVGATALVALLWTFLKLHLFLFLFGNVIGDPFSKIMSEWFFNSLSCIATWSAIYFAFCYERASHFQTLRLHQVESAAKDAHIRMLQYQLNPHFLFNTLASISALIGENRSIQSRQMIEQLSDFLRSSLRSTSRFHQIKQEIATLERYLAIESVRFQQRLKVDISCDKASLSTNIPPLLLQPLIENAIKHHVAITSGPVTISVQVEQNDQQVIITICNEGEEQLSIAVSEHTGVGLKNCADRLNSIYGNEAEFLILPITKPGFKVRIKLPLLRDVSYV